jgi:hypothetical protein
MQLIRAINKANKSNNNYNNNNSNNQTSSSNNVTTTNSKVVIVAPPTAAEKSQSLQVSQNANSSCGAVVTPVSPSASLPPLKKRTSIVKQSVPPPVPPRGSPRSKSKKSFTNSYNFNSSTCNRYHKIDRDKLKSLEAMGAECGTQKVKKWLESVELPVDVSQPVDDDLAKCQEFKFKSVKRLIESFSTKDSCLMKKPVVTKARISDSSLVKARVENYNFLECSSIAKLNKKAQSSYVNETDSGIESSIKVSDKLLSSAKTSKIAHHQFSRDGEFV